MRSLQRSHINMQTLTTAMLKVTAAVAAPAVTMTPYAVAEGPPERGPRAASVSGY